jgi:hypothetical protein
MAVQKKNGMVRVNSVYAVSVKTSNQSTMRKTTMLVLALLFANSIFAQFPEGFEGGTFPPAGWNTFIGQNGLGTLINWAPTGFPASGTGAAYIDAEFSETQTALSEDWLVTPQVAITPSNSTLTFWQNHFSSGASNSRYEIRVSTTSPTDIASFVTIAAQNETQLPDQYRVHSVSLGAYVGQSVYVAFVFSGLNGGDSWYIDDVNFINPFSLTTCPDNVSPVPGAQNVFFDPENFGIAGLTWSAPATGIAPEYYEVYLGTSFDNMALYSETTETTATVTELQYNTTYYWRIVAATTNGTALFCDAWSFSTIHETPIVPEYFTDFDEGYADVKWTYATGALAGPPVYTFLNEWNYWDYANNFQNPLGAYINLEDPGTQDWFRSPLFDLSHGPHYLNFDIALTQFDETTPAEFSEAEFIALMASTDEGLTWTEINRWDHTTPVSNTGQPVTEIVLNQTGNTKFAFFASVGETNSDIDFFINNFRISNTSLGIIHNEMPQLAFFPNPVKDILHLASPERITKIEVLNLLGQKIEGTAFNPDGQNLDMSALPSGTYIVKLATYIVNTNLRVLKE